jgi:hypothetical protein
MPSYIVSSSKAATATPPMPTGAANGDLIVVFAYRSGTTATAPTLPTSWTTIVSRATAPPILLAYRVYDGVWTMAAFTNATECHAVAIRGRDTVTPAGANANNGATAQNIAVTALTTQQLDGRDLTLRGMVHNRSDQAIAVPALHAGLQSTGASGTAGYLTAVVYGPSPAAATFNTARSDLHSWAQVEIRGASPRTYRTMAGAGTG